MDENEKQLLIREAVRQLKSLQGWKNKSIAKGMGIDILTAVLNTAGFGEVAGEYYKIYEDWVREEIQRKIISYGEE